ncbi:MAG: protein translocase subunit SecF, partial [Candidatus Woesearchaeota archaeon]
KLYNPRTKRVMAFQISKVNEQYLRCARKAANDLDLTPIYEIGDRFFDNEPTKIIPYHLKIDMYADEIDAFIAAIMAVIPGTNKESLQENISTIGASLSSDFFRTAILAVIIAFIFMALVVFITFKLFVPSAAIVLCVFSDIVSTIALYNLLGFELSTAGIAGLLMLIGYSVDTDILLSTRVFKRKEGTIDERILKALKTGFAMTFTTIAAVAVGLYFSTSAELQEIFTIILIGLLFDLIYTWIQNVGIIRWYAAKQEQKTKGQQSYGFATPAVSYARRGDGQ